VEVIITEALVEEAEATPVVISNVVVINNIPRLLHEIRLLLHPMDIVPARLAGRHAAHPQKQDIRIGKMALPMDLPRLMMQLEMFL
jgi:hypothetical protein